MDTMLIKAKFTGKSISLSPDMLDYVKSKGHKKIALYASVQFTHLLEPILKQLESIGVDVISSKPCRANEKYQMLGCVSYKAALRLEEDPDAFLYIGDGNFHPRALVLAQKDEESFKEIIRYDPVADKVSIMGLEECEPILKKYKGNLTKVLASKCIGVVISVKPGQEQFKVAKKLKDAYPDKEFYFFATETLDPRNLEDFNFVEAWVNTACPRIGFDDAAEMRVSMCNITDVLALSSKR
ncbi:diphthamide synthesis protein [Candidatus Woesearchaeota archaeon]|nr:diphthamide synthesis protein [Candidatus Woesearchaeota archaeon]